MAPADEEQAIGREKTCFSYLDATPKFDLGPFCTKNTNFVSVFVERDDVTARKNQRYRQTPTDRQNLFTSACITRTVVNRHTKTFFK